MTKIVKNRLLKHLNYLKSMGFLYSENVNIVQNRFDNFSLPNNLEELNSSVMNCYLCDLCKSRKNILFAFGNPRAKIMFIYDEPKKSEDELAMHYTSKGGELLSNMIENVLKIKKEEVYLTSLVKCRSVNGLENSYVNSCSDYLYKQIELVNPSLIVLLGENTYNFFVHNGDDFTKARGKELYYNNRLVIPTFSTKYLLRNPSLKKDAYYDMLKIKNIMEGLH